MRCRDLDLGQLLASRTELVHVALCNQAVHSWNGGSPHRTLEAVLRSSSRICRDDPRLTRQPGECDQGNAALACGNRLKRVPYVAEIGRASRIRAVDMAYLEAHVVDERQASQDGDVRVAEIAVNVTHAEARVSQGAGSDLRVHLCE